MDVCKSASPVSPDELVAESNAAASNLHNALVVLRNELVLKNKRIEELERKLERENSSMQSPAGGGDKSFDEIFELVKVETSKPLKGARRRASKPQVGVDEIMVFKEGGENNAEDEEGKEEQVNGGEFEAGPPTEDPIMAFVLSEKEDDDDHEQRPIDDQDKSEGRISNYDEFRHTLH